MMCPIPIAILSLYKSLGIPFYLLNGNNLVLSAHERTSESFLGETPIQYSYEYYPFGALKKVVMRNYRTAPHVTVVDYYMNKRK